MITTDFKNIKLFSLWMFRKRKEKKKTTSNFGNICNVWKLLLQVFYLWKTTEYL